MFLAAPELAAHLEQVELRAHQGHQVLVGLLEAQAVLEQVEAVVRLDQAGRPGLLGRVVLPELLDQEDLLELLGRVEPLVLVELLGLVEHLALLAHLELLEAQEELGLLVEQAGQGEPVEQELEALLTGLLTFKELYMEQIVRLS